MPSNRAYLDPCHTGTQVYDSADSIKWSRPKGRLYILAKLGSRDLRKLQPPPTILILSNLPNTSFLQLVYNEPELNAS